MPPVAIPSASELETRWVLAFGALLFLGGALVAVFTARDTMLALKSRVRREQR